MTQPKKATGKAAAATAEVENTEHTITFKGGEFTIPAAMPFRVLERQRVGDVVGIVEILLGDQMEKFWASDPSLPEVEEGFINEVLLKYGVTAGESKASRAS